MRAGFSNCPYLEFLRGALLIVSDAATAGGSSPRLYVDRASPGFMLQFVHGGYCSGTHSAGVVCFPASCLRI